MHEHIIRLIVSFEIPGISFDPCDILGVPNIRRALKTIEVRERKASIDLYK